MRQIMSSSHRLVKQNILKLVFHASPLQSKNKDLLARNQDNVSRVERNVYPQTRTRELPV